MKADFCPRDLAHPSMRLKRGQSFTSCLMSLKLPSLGRLLRGVRENGVFAGLLLIAMGLYGWVAAIQWYNMDEGAYLNAADAIVRGGIPFVTFAAREPVILYYLAAGVAVFGPQLFVARMQMVLVDMATAVAVYLLGRDLGGKSAGIAAAGIFLFNPFDVYAFSTVLLEPLAALPLAWIAYLLLRRSRPDPVRVPLAIGLLLGIAELTRRDAVLLAPLILSALIVRHPSSPRNTSNGGTLKGSAIFLLGLAIPLVTVLGIFASLTSFGWMWDQFGLGSAYVEQSIPLQYHLSVLYYLWVYEPLLIIPAVAVPAGVLAARGHRDLSLLSLLLSAGLLGFVLFTGPVNYDWGQGEYDLVATGGLLVVQLVLWAVTAFDIEFSARPGPKMGSLALIFLGLWAVLYLFFYVVVYPEFLTNYFTDVSVPLSVLAGIWWADRVARPLLEAGTPSAATPVAGNPGRWVPAMVALALVTTMVGAGVFSAVEVLGPSNPYNEPLAYDLPQYNVIQRTYSPQLVAQVAHYLDSTNTTSKSVMFSADDIFLAAADRPNLLNLSIVLDQMAYVSYPNDQSTYPYDPFHLAPSMDALLQAWNRTYVPYVVVGSRTSELEIMHPVIGWYIQQNYHVSTTFGNSLSWNYVTIWARGPPVVAPAVPVGSFPAGSLPASISIDPRNGTTYVGSLNSSWIHAFNPSGQTWNFSLPSASAGVRYLAIDPAAAELWCAETGPGNLSSSVARFALLNGSPPRYLGADIVGYAPDAIAFDEKRHLAFVSSLAMSNVTVLNSSTGGFVTTYAVGAAPVALAVDPASGTLYVAASGSASIPIYNETTGQLISTWYASGPPSNLLLTPGYLLVSIWSPGQLDWINRTLGTVSAVQTAGDGAQGLSLMGNTVAVAGQEAGNITFYNVSSTFPEGVLNTGGCPNAISFIPRTPDLYAVGPCPTPLEKWRLSPLVNWTIETSSSGAVYLDGAFVPPNYPLPVLPGLHTLLTLAPDHVPFGFVFYVYGSGQGSPPLGPTLSGIEQQQQEFTLEVTLAAGAILLLVALLPAWPQVLRAARRPVRAGGAARPEGKS